ncbi:ankyrin repeat domain-containing protein [Priestia flexa]|uniref:ankyrin repeat domain-containing protein n=1 Tax=Priestia flexa TaxID=86664 RepID=UPI0007A51A9D
MGADIEPSSTLSSEELLVSYILDNDIESVQMIISDGVNINADIKDTRPLIAAVRDGHIEIARLLLEAGADPNLTESAVNYSTMEAAFDVYSEGDAKPEHFIYELCELLLNYGAYPNTEFVNGKTVLENAMDNDFSSVVHLLQEYGAGI